MVKLPPQFAATWHPGYFWNTEDERLYSMKIDGILKPLKLTKPNRFNHLHEPGYRVSVQGQRTFMAVRRLKKYCSLEQDYEVPMRR